MALYEDLAQIDILTPVLAQLKSGQYKLKPDGSIKLTGELGIIPDAAWITVRITDDRNCFLWSRVYFEHYGLLSRNCFSCFKVVVRPKNLDDLFAIHAMQKKMNLPSKAGIEKRPWATHKGNYAAFWYCPMEGGLEGAREHHKLVERAVHDAVGVDTPVILKRGCTEMEDRWGPSDEWEYPEGQEMFEDLLDSSWDVQTPLIVETVAVQVTRKLDWIDYARVRGDKTAEKYYSNYRIVGITPTVTYHDVAREIKVPYRGQRKGKSLAEFRATDDSDPTGLSADE